MYKLLSFSTVMLFWVYQSMAQVFPTELIHTSGSTFNNINVVIMGDGYTAAEQSKFITDATSVKDYLLAQKPYSQYVNYMNVTAVKVVSLESGAKHPNNTPECPSDHPASNPNNYFGSTFDYAGIHRLLYVTSQAAVYDVLAANTPDYDIVYVLVNTPFYGGGGGNFGVGSTNASANEVALHELGHSFGGLADEYYYGGPYVFGESPNRTLESDPLLVKWKNWVGTDNIGVFNYCCGNIWYKPTNATCKMELLGPEYCNVCKETIIERFHDIVHPLESFIPATPSVNISNPILDFKLTKLKLPIPNTLKITWNLNGVNLPNGTDSLSIVQANLPANNSILKVFVEDTTPSLRVNNHSIVHLDSAVWTIIKNVVNPCATDIIPPVFGSCPANINLTTTSTCATASWTTPTANDNCGTPSVALTSGLSAGSCFPVGTNAVVYTATDAKVNKATCSFNVVVSTISNNCTLNAVAGNGFITLTGVEPNGFIQLFTCNWAPITIPAITGSTMTLNTGNGCFIIKYWGPICGEKRFDINVSNSNPCTTDIESPVFTNCPTNINSNTIGTTAIVNWTAPTATDNCGIPTITSTHNSGTSFPIGTTIVLYTASDAKGNKSTCSFNITVVGTTNLQPDLTLANLNLTSRSVNPGVVLNYRVDIKNIGAGNAPGNFNVKAYISTDNILSTNDIQNGNINTGNFNAGFTTYQVPGSSTIPSSLAPGQYYLIVVVDADNTITESNENNNMIVTTSPFVVNPIVVGNKEDLEVTITSSNPNPAIYSNVNFTITVKNNSTISSNKFRVNINTCASGIIKTFIQNPGTLVYAGKPIPSSVGIFDEVNQTWTFNSLAAGTSASYTINAFTLSSKEITMTAFIDQQTNSDFDSNPNATMANCIPVEDDESAVVINKGSTRESINSIDINNVVSLFPNPVSDILNVNIMKWDNQAVEIGIYNSLGVLIMQESLEEKHSPIHSIDVEKLHDGNYFMFIQGKSTRSQALKFVKHKSY